MSELPPNAVTFDWNCLTGVIICGAHVAPFVKRGVSKRKGPKYNRIVFTVGMGGGSIFRYNTTFIALNEQNNKIKWPTKIKT